MPLNPAGVNQAQTRQHAAAHDQSAAVRLVAGPGTGKSASIEERFFWLLNSGLHPRHIYGVSFTRAASKDLRILAGLNAQGYVAPRWQRAIYDAWISLFEPPHDELFAAPIRISA